MININKKLLSFIIIAILLLNIFLFGCSDENVGNQDTLIETNEQNKQIVNIEEKEKVESEYTVVLNDEDFDLSIRDSKGKNGAVSTANPIASKIGLHILEEGGNAVDAAVAIGFALGVVEPNASGIGGGGYMLIHLSDTNEQVFIDFRETAPLQATDNMFEIDENGNPVDFSHKQGPLAAAIPGEVAGLLTALDNYGTLSRQEVMVPAIEYAEHGVIVSEKLSSILIDNYDKISKNLEASEIYLNNGLPFMPGEKLKNPDLAKTLKTISIEGAESFYKGELSKRIVKGMNALGGLISEEDLANYTVDIKEPIKGTYRGYEIVTSPISSSGGTHIIEVLNIMENFDLSTIQVGSTKYIHAWAQAFKIMYNDRQKYIGDIGLSNLPIDGLLSKEYAKEQYDRINMDSTELDLQTFDVWEYNSGSTTHYSIVDKDGNMVSVTKTINSFFGSGVVIPDTGIIMNNEMSDFDLRPNNPNSIKGGKRPISNMSPTFILKEDIPFATLGSPGGMRILSTVALIISNIIDYNMDIQSAIEFPKFNQLEDGNLKIESRISEEIKEELSKLGHVLEMKKEYDLYFGGAQGITIDLESSIMHGGADPRRDGKAMCIE